MFAAVCPFLVLERSSHPVTFLRPLDKKYHGNFLCSKSAPSKTAMDEIMTHLSTSKRNQEGAPEKRCLPWSSVRTGYGM